MCCGSFWQCFSRMSDGDAADAVMPFVSFFICCVFFREQALKWINEN